MINILQRINDIRKELDYVKKDATVAGYGYKAVTHDAITAASRSLFIKHGVVCIPNLVKSSFSKTGTLTAKGIEYIRYEATYELTFASIDDPADKVIVRIEAHAMDEGDKAPGKALSYAKKYAVLKLFEIETGEDEESRFDAKAAKLDPERIKDYEKQIAQAVDAETLTKVWQELVSACHEAKDVPSYEHLKAKVEEAGKRIKG